MEASQFAWLLNLRKGPCFTTGDWNRPAKTTDFGDNGHTASLTDWHELLQITAPDLNCGIVFVRGDFPRTADAALARAQQRDVSGKRGTFGLEIDSKGSDFMLGERRNQGFVNFRWPYSQYELRRRYAGGGMEQIQTGTYEAISFAKDGIIYQVLCLRAGKLHQSTSQEHPGGLRIRFKLGRDVQFGCPCCSDSLRDVEEGNKHADELCQLESLDEGKRLVCASSWYQKRLEIQLFVNDEPMTIQRILSLGENSRGQGDGSWMHEVEIGSKNPTFVVATYRLRPRNVTESIIGRDSFASIAKHLGVLRDSEKMSDRLWTACLTANYDAAEGLEFCAIGTAVEQILCVSSVPVTSQPTLAGNQENKGIALVRNIMVGQYVDLQSTFWQVRLLVKVCEFLRSRKLEPDPLDPVQALSVVRNAYLDMLHCHIRRVLIWLLESNLDPDRITLAIPADAELIQVGVQTATGRLQHCLNQRKLMKITGSYNQVYFVTITVWFVMKHCPEAITEDFKAQFILPRLGKLSRCGDTQDNRGDNDPSSRNNVLQWFHLSCLFLICQSPFGKDANSKVIDGFAISGLNSGQIFETQERSEKSVTRLRKGKTEAYSTEDEELDRLFLLADELDFQSLRSQASSRLALARAKQTYTKISERKPTIRFHPGPRTSKAGDAARMISNGPWELTCLNHHMLLRTTLDTLSELSAEACRDACFEFLQSDYTFMTSWDRADKAMVEKLWNFETGSIVCATLLDLKVAGVLKAAESEQKVNNLGSSVAESAKASIEGEGHSASAGTTRGNLPRADSLRDLLQLLKQELVQNERGSAASNRPFDWFSWKPPRIYHPMCWAKLMNGVAREPNQKRLKLIPPQLEIIRYLSGSDENEESKELETHMGKIGQLLGEDLDYISIFDLVASYDFTFSSREHQSMTSNCIISPINNHNLPPLASTATRRVQPLQENTLALLNRTLVDSGTKYRILFAERCSPSILKAFICGWHPDALATFDNYLGTSSRFSDSREAMWTTTITISHWSIQHTDSSKEYPKRFHEGRIKGDFPPASIANLKLVNGSSSRGKPPHEKPGIRVIEERSTSLVMTGDSHGFFWVCTVWSSLTKYKHIVTSVNSLPAVLQSFINQQACGRCLIFLVLLGHLCERLAREHEKMLKHLNTVVDLGEKILLDGIKLDKSDAVERLERMLWGLEALRVFDDRLSTSLSQIRKAREALEHTIDQEAAQQDIELVQEYKNILEEFSKRYGALLDVQIKIQLRIRQVTGLRDGISAVSNVRDSRTAREDTQTTLKQGSNIRVLTLITIAYLPFGFVTSLFSTGQILLPEGTGTTLYIVLGVALSIATYIVALTLGTILDIIQPGWEHLKEKILPKSAESSEVGENGVGSANTPPTTQRHSRSRSAQSRSQRGTILPIIKDQESSDANV